MGIGKRIKEARLNKGLTQSELAELIGVTNSAIANYENETSHPKEPVMYALIEALGVDANFLFQDAVHLNTQDFKLSLDEVQGVKKYRALDEHGKKMVNYAIKEETARMEAVNKPIEDNVIELPKKRSIPCFGTSFAAGPAEPDTGNAMQMIEVDAKQKGDFALRITGDSMEPYLHDGQLAFGVQGLPDIGEVGAFLLDGEFLCKQYVEDNMGNIYLLSLNRDREDCDVKVWRNGNRNLVCFGKIPIKGVKGPLPIL